MQKEQSFTKAIVKNGFSLVEIVLSVSVFALIVTALAGSYVYGRESAALSGDRARAMLIADEGIQAVQNIKDASWTNLSDGTYGLATSSGQWIFSGGSDTSNQFTRTVSVATIDSYRKGVTSTVSWQQNGQRSGSVSIFTELTNWTAAAVSSAFQIAYYDLTNKDLKWATCTATCTTAGNWSTVTADMVSAKDVGQYTSIGTYNGNPRIAYYNVTDMDLKYASCDTACTTASNWTVITLDSTGNVGQYPSLKIDSSGNPRISYYDATNGSLKYTSCTTACTSAANWTTITVDTVGDTGQYTSLALTSAGGVRISYYDATLNVLKYAACDTTCTTVLLNWSVATIDTPGFDVGRFSSLALDSSGNPKVAYYDFTNKDLRYAACTTLCLLTTSWTKTTLISTGDVGQYASLALDSSGNPRISYYDLTNKDLKYAACTSTCTTAGNWTHVILDATGDVGLYTFLRTDTNGTYISYYDNTNKDLKWATCAATCTTAANWTLVKVDTTGDVGKFTSM